ncbi:hypothetical protein TWF481_008271 [Arthrobotrys musiformis]|uniref:Haloacid dehalogenase n=1 Tax=Arthrobotrys musiformis TaxID=47236 RepID=A0AAV9W8M9_9PEZI
MAPKTLDTLPTAFVFDVFGTVYDWRTTISSEISKLLSQKLTSLDARPSSTSAANGSQPDLSTPEAITKFSKSFAQEWRDGYKNFVVTHGGTRLPIGTPDINNNDKEVSLNDVAPSIPRATAHSEPSEEPYTTVDSHHLQSLRGLLKKYSLYHLFTPSEIYALSRAWHTLKAWDDSQPGIDSLKNLAIVSTLSNGNFRLLVDLQRTSGVKFDALLSGQLWRGYKPEAKVYVGACEVLGVGGKEEWEEYLEENGDVKEGEDEWRFKERGKVAMVAAHMGDLRAAKACGLTTIYIERPKEDDTEDAGDQYLKNREDWVDMWVKHEEGGILEAARRLSELKRN